MKKLKLFVVLIASLSLGACASTPAAQHAQVDLLVGLASDAAAIALIRNPGAVPVLQAISVGIQNVLTGGSLREADVNALVDRIEHSRGTLSDAERVMLRRAVITTHSLLILQTGLADLPTTDPRVKDVLTRLKTAIDDALAVSNPTPK
jgi:hypothetical protein